MLQGKAVEKKVKSECLFSPFLSFFLGGGVKLWSERTHVDKSYGHQSGPPNCMPKSVVPLIIRGRHPNRAAHTASFIPADQFTQQTFCFGL